MSFDRKLITLVRQYPILYDNTNQHYYDCGLKEIAWKEISTALNCNESADELKIRWTARRDCFRKAMIKRKRIKEYELRPWKYEEEMSFLKPHLGYPKKKQKNNLQISSFESERKNEYIGEEMKDVSREQNFSSSVEKNVKVPSHSEGSSNIPRSSVSPFSAIRKAELPQQVTVADERQTCFDINYERKQMDPPTPDHLKSFFKAMEDSVRTFSPLQQAQVKSQISSLVSKIEIRNQEALFSSCDHCGNNSKRFQSSPTDASIIQGSKDPLEISPTIIPPPNPSHSASQPTIQLHTSDSAQNRFFSSPASPIRKFQMKHPIFSVPLLIPSTASAQNCSDISGIIISDVHSESR